MTALYMWWKLLAIYSIITSQVVLSGVLHASEEIRNSSQEIQGDDLKHDNPFTYRVNEEKYIEENGKTIKYGEIIDKQFEKPLENNDTVSKIINENNTLLEENVANVSHTKSNSNTENEEGITKLKDITNKKESKNKKPDVKPTLLNGKDTTYNSSDDHNSPQPLKLNLTVDLLNLDNNNNDKLINDDYNLHKENDNEYHTKKHKKREYNYPYNYKNDEYNRKSANRFDSNYNRHYRNNDYNIDSSYKRSGYLDDIDDDGDEDIYDNDDDTTDDDDDVAFDAALEDFLREEEEEDDDQDDDIEEYDEIRRKMYQSKIPQSKPVNYDYGRRVNHTPRKPNRPQSGPEEESIKAFTDFLNTVINKKLVDMMPKIDLNKILKANQTKQGHLINQLHHQPKNSTVMINKINDYPNIEDEMYSDSIKQDWRNTRHVRSPDYPENCDDFYQSPGWKNNYKNVYDVEEKYRLKSLNYDPYIVLCCNDDLFSCDEDDGDKPKPPEKCDDENKPKPPDDNCDDKKCKKKDKKNKDCKKSEHKVDKRENYREGTQSSTHLNDQSTRLNNNGNREKMSENYDQASYNAAENVSRNVVDKNLWDIFNVGSSHNENRPNNPQFETLNNEKPEISSVYKLHDIFDHSDQIKQKCEYVPDTVMMYLVDNFLQNVPTAENTSNPMVNHTGRNDNSKSSKTKRDLRNNSESDVEYQEIDTDFINNIILALEKVVMKFLPEYIPGITNRLTEHQKEIINKNILNEIFHQIPKQQSQTLPTHHSSIQYHHMNPIYDSHYKLKDGEVLIKREIDKQHFDTQHDHTKPNVNIKNVNIYYERGDEEKTYHPIEPMNSLKYQKRQSLPQQATAFNHRVANREFDLLSSEPKLLLTRNPNGKLTVSRKVSTENKSKSTENGRKYKSHSTEKGQKPATGKLEDDSEEVVNDKKYDNVKLKNAKFSKISSMETGSSSGKNSDDNEEIEYDSDILRYVDDDIEPEPSYSRKDKFSHEESDTDNDDITETTQLASPEIQKDENNGVPDGSQDDDNEYLIMSNKPDDNIDESETNPNESVDAKRILVNEEEKNQRKNSNKDTAVKSNDKKMYMMPLPLLRNKSESKESLEQDSVTYDESDSECNEGSVCYLDKNKKPTSNSAKKPNNKNQIEKSSSVEHSGYAKDESEEGQLQRKKVNKNQESKETDRIKNQRNKSQKSSTSKEDLIDYNPNQDEKLTYDTEDIDDFDTFKPEPTRNRPSSEQNEELKKLHKSVGEDKGSDENMKSESKEETSIKRVTANKSREKPEQNVTPARKPHNGKRVDNSQESLGSVTTTSRENMSIHNSGEKGKNKSSEMKYLGSEKVPMKNNGKKVDDSSAEDQKNYKNSEENEKNSDGVTRSDPRKISSKENSRNSYSKETSRFNSKETRTKYDDSITKTIPQDQTYKEKMKNPQSEELFEEELGNDSDNENYANSHKTSAEISNEDFEYKTKNGNKDLKNSDDQRDKKSGERNMKYSKEIGAKQSPKDSKQKDEKKGKLKMTENSNPNQGNYVNKKEVDDDKQEKLTKGNEKSDDYYDDNDNDEHEIDDYNEDEDIHYTDKGTATFDQLDEDDMRISHLPVKGIKQKHKSIDDDYYDKNYDDEDDGDMRGEGILDDDDEVEEEEDYKTSRGKKIGYSDGFDETEDGPHRKVHDEKIQNKNPVTPRKENKYKQYQRNDDNEDEDDYDDGVFVEDIGDEDDDDDDERPETQNSKNIERRVNTPNKKKFDDKEGEDDYGDVEVEDEEEDEKEYQEEEEEKHGDVEDEDRFAEYVIKEPIKAKSKENTSGTRFGKYEQQDEEENDDYHVEDAEAITKLHQKKKTKGKLHSTEFDDNEEEYEDIDVQKAQKDQKSKENISKNHSKYSNKKPQTIDYYPEELDEYDEEAEDFEQVPQQKNPKKLESLSQNVEKSDTKTPNQFDDDSVENTIPQKPNKIQTQVKQPIQAEYDYNKKQITDDEEDDKDDEDEDDEPLESDNSHFRNNRNEKDMIKSGKFEHNHSKNRNSQEDSAEKKYMREDIKLKSDEMKSGKSRGKTTEIEEPEQSAKVQRKSDEILLKDELSKPKMTQKRKAKSHQFLTEEDIFSSANDNRKRETTNSHRNHEDDYIKKHDVEKMIKEMLHSTRYSKHSDEMFPNKADDKYKDLVKDIATYFTKKNVTSGDDICIYEEYGHKCGDSDVIYLSGTKLYQNGIPKKDAQNFNLVIRKPHHEADDEHRMKQSDASDDDYDQEDIDYDDDTQPDIILNSLENERYQKRQANKRSAKTDQQKSTKKRSSRRC